jgi:hypothetical protein
VRRFREVKSYFRPALAFERLKDFPYFGDVFNDEFALDGDDMPRLPHAGINFKGRLFHCLPLSLS